MAKLVSGCGFRVKCSGLNWARVTCLGSSWFRFKCLALLYFFKGLVSRVKLF